MSAPLSVTFTEVETLYPEVPTRILNLHSEFSRMAVIIPAGGGGLDAFFWVADESQANIIMVKEMITRGKGFILLVNV
jgi:hypothetical protein